MIPFTYITLKHTNQNNDKRVGVRLKTQQLGIYYGLRVRIRIRTKEKGLNKEVRIRKRIKEVGLEQRLKKWD